MHLLSCKCTTFLPTSVASAFTLKAMRRSLGPLLCELHSHTRWSDGELTVAELVDLHGRRGRRRDHRGAPERGRARAREGTAHEAVLARHRTARARPSVRALQPHAAL